MDKIVSLSRRRGFVFPSSEIYGGMGSTFDYGHYGSSGSRRWSETGTTSSRSTRR
jgi:glycyl-tRNA synthetase (class II)